MELATEPPAMNDQVQLWVMATLAFAVFYSNYMVAPLLSAFSKEFAVPVYQLRWLIAGYLIPYVGLALAGYGLPGIFFGTMIGRWRDRYGRRYVVPFGFLWAAGCAFLLLPHSSRFVAALAITALSVGFDTTHPLMSSITTSPQTSRTDYWIRNLRELHRVQERCSFSIWSHSVSALRSLSSHRYRRY